jgi:hypothetical protein
MPGISLTDFVDFVISSGTPKLTKVGNIKNRREYQPAFDFWKPLRDGIVAFHRARSQNRRDLDRITSGVTDQKKSVRYPECIRAYKRFLGRKRVSWFAPPTGRWGPQDLTIRINPELGLNINGIPHVIKLYFKAEPLSRRRVEIVLLLLQAALQGQVRRGTHYAILDVPRARLFEDPHPNASLLPLLQGEASSFLTIWNNI